MCADDNMICNNSLQFYEATVEKMPTIRENDNRLMLRARPIKDIGKWNHIIIFSVYNQCIGGGVGKRKAFCRWCDQHSHRWRGLLSNAGLNVGAERKTGQRQWQFSCLRQAGSRILERSQGVVNLTVTVIPDAFRAPDTAEIEAHRRKTEGKKTFGERINDLIIERASFQRVRMRDQREAAHFFGDVERDFQRASRAVDSTALQGLGVQICNLLTIWLPDKCWSMISSISDTVR